MFENCSVNLGLVRKHSIENLISYRLNFIMALLLLCHREMPSFRWMIGGFSFVYTAFSNMYHAKFKKTVEILCMYV